MARTAVGQDKTKLRPQEPLYTALMDGRFDFTWYRREVETVRQMWGKGKHISEIARLIKRDTDEVAILLMDQARIGKIKRRKGGVYGTI